MKYSSEQYEKAKRFRTAFCRSKTDVDSKYPWDTLEQDYKDNWVERFLNPEFIEDEAAKLIEEEK